MSRSAVDTPPDDLRWCCQECGLEFPDEDTAMRHAQSDQGCPGCDGQDIALSLPVSQSIPRWGGAEKERPCLEADRAS